MHRAPGTKVRLLLLLLLLLLGGRCNRRRNRLGAEMALQLAGQTNDQLVAPVCRTGRRRRRRRRAGQEADTARAYGVGLEAGGGWRAGGVKLVRLLVDFALAWLRVRRLRRWQAARSGSGPSLMLLFCLSGDKHFALLLLLADHLQSGRHGRRALPTGRRLGS